VLPSPQLTGAEVAGRGVVLLVAWQEQCEAARRVPPSNPKAGMALQVSAQRCVQSGRIGFFNPRRVIYGILLHWRCADLQLAHVNVALVASVILRMASCR